MIAVDALGIGTYSSRHPRTCRAMGNQFALGTPDSMSMSAFFPYPDEEQPDQEPKFLAQLSESALQKIYSIGEIQRFEAGDIAVTEGGLDTSLYIVLEGEAEVSIPKRKGWLNVAVLRPGSVFGELSFFDHMPRSARVSVITDCVFLRFSEHSFQRLLVHDSSLAMALVLDLGKILSLRLRHMNQLVQDLLK